MSKPDKDVRLAITIKDFEDSKRIKHVTAGMGFSTADVFLSPREAYKTAARKQYRVFITYQSFPDMSGLTMIQSLRATGNYGLESHLILVDQLDRDMMVLLAEYNIKYVVTKPFSSDHIAQKLKSLWHDESNQSEAEKAYREAHAALQSGLADMALDLGMKLVKEHKPLEKHLLLLGDVLLKLGNIEEARRTYQKAHERYPDSYVPVHKAAALLMKEKRYAEAAPMFDDLCKLSPLNLEILANTGLANFEIGLFKPAKAAMMRLKALDKERKDANELLARVAIREGDYPKSLQFLQEGHSATEYCGILHGEADALRKQNAYMRVVDFYLKTIELLGDHPQLFDFYYRLGLAYLDIYDEISAKRYFQQALKLMPDYEPARKALAPLTKASS